MSKKIIGRALGAGAALATATALILPGVASAAPGSGSADLLPGLDGIGGSSDLLDLGTLQCVFKALTTEADDSPGDPGPSETDDGSDLNLEALLACFGELSPEVPV